MGYSEDNAMKNKDNDTKPYIYIDMISDLCEKLKFKMEYKSFYDKGFNLCQNKLENIRI